jgi:hypothetical protein
MKILVPILLIWMLTALEPEHAENYARIQNQIILVEQKVTYAETLLKEAETNDTTYLNVCAKLLDTSQ